MKKGPDMGPFFCYEEEDLSCPEIVIVIQMRLMVKQHI